MFLRLDSNIQLLLIFQTLSDECFIHFLPGQQCFCQKRAEEETMPAEQSDGEVDLVFMLTRLFAGIRGHE